MTGDVTINPTASCLVMTTEVCCMFSSWLGTTSVLMGPKDSTFDALSWFRDRTRGSVGYLRRGPLYA